MRSLSWRRIEQGFSEHDFASRLRRQSDYATRARQPFQAFFTLMDTGKGFRVSNN